MSVEDLEKAKKEVADLKEEIAGIQSWEDDMIPLANYMQSHREPKSAWAGKIKQRRTLLGMSGKIADVAWAGNSRRLLQASQTGKLIVWNAFTNQKEMFASMDSSWVMCCDVNFRGDLIAAGGLDNAVSIYKIGTDGKNTDVKLTHVLKEHSGYVSSIQFLGKDEVVTSGGDGKVLFWDLESGKVKDEVQQAIGDVSDCSMMGEHMFCTGSTSMNAKVFDRRTQKEVMNFGGAEVGGHGAPINTVKANPACPTTTFASGADDAIARLFDVRACKQMNSMEGSNSPEDYSITDMSFSKSGRALFVSYTVPVFWAWDVKSADLLNSQAGHKQQVAALRVSPDGKVLCTASWDATMGIWA